MPFAGMRFLVVFAVAIAAVHASASAATPGAGDEVQRRARLEAGIVSELNEVRAARGLRPLRAAPSLRTAARSHSTAMLELGFFGHNSADGTAFSDRIRRYYTSRGWQTWSVGEALLANEGPQLDAKAIVRAWLASPPHREIILSPGWRDTGVGAVYTATAPEAYGGAEAVVVTADFGFREGRS
jgi:uncharacterized protein YkwD